MHVVIAHRGTSRDVELLIDDPAATVADLVEAIGGCAPDTGITVAGRFQAASTPLDATGLHEGAVVTIGHAPQSPGPRSLTGPAMAVIDGPAAGAAIPIDGAPLRIGRAARCDVTIGDATVSAEHAVLDRRADGSIEVTDLGSRNGTFLDGRAVLGSATVATGEVVELGATRLRLTGRRPDDRPASPAALAPGPSGLVAFNRPPRSALPPPPAPLRPPQAPAPPQAARALSLVAVIAPLVIGGVLVVAYDNPLFALFLLLSPVMAIGTWLSGRREARRQRRSGSRAYRSALDAFAQQLAAAERQERIRREIVLPDLAEVTRRIRAPSTLLWQRRPGHGDFLHVRGGCGTVRWEVPLDGDRDGLPDEVEDLVARAGVLDGCPVDIDLSAGRVVGIVGDRGMALRLARSLVVQACAHHGPADLGVVVLAAAGHARDWDWAKWLPHVRDHTGSGHLLAPDPVTADALLEAVLEAAGRDREERRGAGPDGRPLRTRLYVIDDAGLTRGRQAPARRILRGEGGPLAGIVCVETVDQLPAVTTTIVELVGDLGEARVRRPRDGHGAEDLVIGGLSAGVARDLARDLACYEDTDLDLPGARLPASLRLLPLLGLDDVDADRVAAAWRGACADPRPRAPIGMGEDGPVDIDLAVDGPHALIGGTTGSGKSELLRCIVAGLAARLDPAHLVFVLIDYKGGSAFDACADLPHTIGLVTDLDDYLGERALRSLRAELRHREQVLRDAGVADLTAYLARDSPLGPLPRLVVVVDEFATLAADLPDFLDALVGVAQRGRSLGMHLILATQRPHGSVSADIMANTNLRIALRVQAGSDSHDVIGRADAASISRAVPGRCYLRTGPGEVAIVQAALSTGPPPEHGARVRLRDFGFGPAPPEPQQDAASSTDLERLARACRAAWTAASLPAPRPVWLPTLPERVAWDELAGVEGEPGDLVFGLADDPDHQRRAALGWRPHEGHLGLFGAVGSGTDTALLGAVRALVEGHAPQDCHVYGLDFGTGRLAALAALPHVGGVVAANDAEGQHRLARLLQREIARRRDLGPDRLPAEPLIVVAVAGLPALLADHDATEALEVGDAFRRALAEGPGVRVVWAFTADRVGGLPPRLSSQVRRSLLFRHADRSEFLGHGFDPRRLPVFVPGRAIDTDSGLVVQVADPGPIAAWGVARGDGGRMPAPVGALPSLLVLPDLEAVPSLEPAPARLPVGVAEEDLAPVDLVLHPGDHALVAGPAHSGVTSALLLIAVQVRRADPRAVIVAVCSARSPLYGAAPFDAAGGLADLADVLSRAQDDPRPWFVVVDEAPHLEDTGGLLGGLVRSQRPGLHVIPGGRTDDLRGAFSHWTRAVRQSRTGVLLQPDPAADGELLGVRLPRRSPVAAAPGRGFLVVAGMPTLAQFALPPRD